MPFKKGDTLFHVTPSGNVHRVTATDDETNGSVPIKYRHGQAAEIGTFHLFSTENAANRAAIDRTSTAKPGLSGNVKFIRDPK
jgi:hypothetical protein